jgi:hypothetical protein
MITVLFNPLKISVNDTLPALATTSKLQQVFAVAVFFCSWTFYMLFWSKIETEKHMIAIC